MILKLLKLIIIIKNNLKNNHLFNLRILFIKIYKNKSFVKVIILDNNKRLSHANGEIFLSWKHLKKCYKRHKRT